MEVLIIEPGSAIIYRYVLCSMKTNLKEKAINLRKQGLTYSEILRQVPVAKSTLSLWLRSVGLSKKQEQKLTKKKLVAARRGGARKREIRIAKTRGIFQEVAKDIKSLSERELFLIGVALYWAEGHKEKENRPGSGVQFSNSDFKMIRLFLNWLVFTCQISRERISFNLFIHRNSENRISKVLDFWVHETGFPITSFQKIYYKKHNPKTKRKNIGDLYYGVLRVRVSKSSDLVRRIAGWVEAINCRVV